MSAVLQNEIAQSEVTENAAQSPKVPWLFMALLLGSTLLVFGTYRWYQQNYSFNVGLDYFEPEFQTYWMNLFYIQMTVIILSAMIIAPIVWFTRPKDVQAITPHQELNYYYLILSLMAVSSIGLLATLGLFVEADAAWHQVTIRDTDFTPTHIALFYFALPIAFVGAALGALWVHTRLPDFANRISVPLAIATAGPVLIMPNLGLNEWGHTFFYAEELFAAPIHWGFVALAWAFFAIAGFILQCLGRVRVLTSVVKIESNENDESNERELEQAA